MITFPNTHSPQDVKKIGNQEPNTPKRIGNFCDQSKRVWCGALHFSHSHRCSVLKRKLFALSIEQCLIFNEK
jgi:hypothetical protein